MEIIHIKNLVLLHIKFKFDKIIVKKRGIQHLISDDSKKENGVMSCEL